MGRYFNTLVNQGGDAWNRFWFSASDAATLGLVRLLTGLVTLYWYATFAFDWQYLFGAKSIIPVDLVETWRTGGVTRTLLQEVIWFSYLDYIGSPMALWVAFGLGLAVLMAFTAGLFSRISSILTYVVVLSIAHRAPMLITPFEETLPMLLLGLCIGPSGAALSLDAWLRRRSGRIDPLVIGQTPGGVTYSFWTTLAIRLLQLQVTIVYVAMVISKFRYDRWLIGDAAWQMITQPESRMFDLTALSGMWPILNGLTLSILVFQLFFPLLVWNRLLRPLALGLSAIGWIVIAMLSGSVAFSLLMFVSGLVFIPAESVRAWLNRCCAPRRTPE